MAWVQSRRVLLLAIAAGSFACGKPKAAPANGAPPPAGLPALPEGERKAQGPLGAVDPHGGAPNPHGGAANPHGGAASPHGGAPSPHAGGASPHAGGLPPVGDGPTTPGGIPFDEKSVIVGSLAVPDAIKPKIAAGDTIFLVVRRASDDGQPGPILAVKKLDAAKTFPQPFVIDGRDAMMVGTALAGKVVVNVRVDKDGNATTKNPGDVIGSSAVIQPPAKQVVIQLDKVM